MPDGARWLCFGDDVESDAEVFTRFGAVCSGLRGSELEQEVFSRYDSEIDSQDLGEIVMTFLSGLDQVAYVRFASVYREFKDASDFMEEVGPLLDSERYPR